MRALSDITRLTRALVTTSLAQLAKSSVLRVCSTWVCAGLIVHIMAVLAFPPSAGWSILVSLESL
jgi:hypothetical protein